MCRRGGCCCRFSLKFRIDAMRQSAINMIVFGFVLAATGIIMRLFLEDWIFNFGYALVWAGVSSVATGIGSLGVAKTMKHTDEDYGFRGLIMLCLVCIICVGGAVGLITWQMWEANYFEKFEEGTVYKAQNETLVFFEWFASIFVYGIVDLASLLIVGSAFLNLAISCCCPESSDVSRVL
ncbi:hypothetical protein BSL78_02771 [Apostichopus japonicus]|uniref:Uncharacterized protein n=1 Tax=Stichopus japonicus TaxID=307972 RepID=A0A2G8LJ69_STIJA|nr:hypothetical protein BSL78_02771 [Apostichopus japonicus]